MTQEKFFKKFLPHLNKQQRETAQTVDMIIPPIGITTFTDTTGVVWRIIKDNRVGAPADSAGKASTGDGTVLLVTDNVYGTGGLTIYGRGINYNGTSEKIDPWVQYGNASIKSSFDSWYITNVSPALKEAARIPVLRYEGEVAPDLSWSESYNLDTAISSASATAARGTTSGVVFPLSISEVNRYIGTTKARIAADVSGLAQCWWLRSAGSGHAYRGSGVDVFGYVGYSNVESYVFALRPALWVDTNGKINVDGMLNPSETTATLTITPATVDVTQGKTQSFTVTATHDGVNVANRVIWSLFGTNNSGTKITGMGANATLTVAATETSKSLAIRATLTGLGATTKDATVNVKYITYTGMPPIGTTTFTDNGIVWRIIKDNRVGAPADSARKASTGDGTVLLVTDNIYGTGGLTSYGDEYSYNGTTSKDQWVQYGNASIKSSFDSWYNTNVSPTLKAVARIPVLRYESEVAPDLSWSSSCNIDTGISSASATAAGETTAGVVFPLSISEVNRYIGTSLAARIATDVSGATVFAQFWWLRSAGNDNAASGSCVGTSGYVFSDCRVGNSPYALRPALWVDTNGNINADGMLKPSEATATLTITPSSVDVMQGKTQSFTVTATHDGVNVANRVIWYIQGANNSGTKITGMGANATLTVAATETSELLIIRATLTDLCATAKDAIVNVKYIPYTDMPPIGTTTFMDNGIVWRIIKDNRVGAPADSAGKASTGDGTVLLVTDNVYNTEDPIWDIENRYNVTNESDPWVQYGSAPIKSSFDSWYSTNVSPALKAAARIPVLRYESEVAPDPSWSESYNLDTAISSASATAAGETTAGVVFPLSISEVNRYIGTSPAARIATDVSGATVFAQNWWLRSAGNDNASYGSDVHMSGTVIGDFRVNICMHAIRPALWVDTNGKINTDGTLKPSEITVTLAITPSSVDVMQGKTQSFTVTATHDGVNVANRITWSLFGANNSGTKVTGTGANVTLAIAATETSKSLAIRATLTGPGATTTTNNATVNVMASIIPPVGTATFRDTTGVVWRIIKDNRVGAPTDSAGKASTGDGTVLLVTDNVYGTGGRASYGSGYIYNSTYIYNGTTSSHPWVQYGSASIKSSFDSWYSRNVSSALKAVARIPLLRYESEVAPDRSWSESYNLDTAISSASATAAGGTTAGVVFPLSISEVNRYIGTSPTARIATDVSGTAGLWWLRSACVVASNGTYLDYANGSIVSITIGISACALRPALWVDTNEKINTDGTLKPSEATATLTITPATVDVTQGKTQSFTVTATHDDMSVTNKEATVNVMDSMIPQFGATTFTDTTGVVWRIIKDNRVGAPADSAGKASTGDGTVLLVTDNVYGNSICGLSNYDDGYSYNGTTESDPWVQYGSASIKSSFDSWYSTNVSPALKAAARIPVLRYESEVVPAPSWRKSYNLNKAISSASATAAGETTSGVVFPLSISEVNRYIGTTKAARRATDVSGTAGYWWLRSAGGYDDVACGSLVDTSGDVRLMYVGYSTFALRPALWVDTNMKIKADGMLNPSEAAATLTITPVTVDAGDVPEFAAQDKGQVMPQNAPKPAPPKTTEKNFYEILEISNNASTQEIQEAIKRQRTLWSNRVCVPRCLTMGNRARQIVKKIGEAEKILLDAKKRTEYDNSLKKPTYEFFIPENEKNWLEVVYQYYDQQDWEMARTAAKQATVQQPQNAEAWFVAGEVYMQLGAYQQVNEAAQQALFLEPDNPYAYELMGFFYLADGKTVSAKEQYKKMEQCAISTNDELAKKRARESFICCEALLYVENNVDPLVDEMYRLLSAQGSYDENLMDRLCVILNSFQTCKREIIQIFGAAETEILMAQEADSLKVLDRYIVEVQDAIDERSLMMQIFGLR